jgi:hypothetical protein
VRFPSSDPVPVGLRAQGAAEPRQTRLTLAGIIATYLPDVDRVLGRSDGGQGVYDHTKGHWPNRVQAGDGWPTYGIQISQDDVRGALAAVGGDPQARAVIGRSATAYNTVLMDRGATAERTWDADASNSQGSPFVGAVTQSAHLYGFLVDNLAQGDIADANSEAKRRAKVAQLFLLPTDLIPMDKAGPAAPIAGIVLDEVKDAITNAYIGDGVGEAVGHGNDDWTSTREALTLQALEAARVHDMLCPSDIDRWPKDTTGRLIPAGAMIEDQRRALLQDVGHDRGYTLVATNSVTGAQDSYRAGFK